MARTSRTPRTARTRKADKGLWECVIVGAGPAGLSAAVYMGRFKRRTLVLDCGDGRWSYGQVNHNYLGFPAGVKGTRLHALGRKQAERFGVAFEDSEVTKVQHDKRGFHLKTKKGTHQARTLIWAAGVRDRWPDFERARRLVGRHLFWCIVCDGWRTRDQRLLVLGNTDPCVGTTLQFLTYTRKITYLCDRTQGRPSSRARAKLAQAGIAYVEGKVRRVVVEKTAFDASSRQKRTSSRQYLPASTAAIRAELLRDLPSPWADGHIRIDDKNARPRGVLRRGLRQQTQPSGRHGRARAMAAQAATSCIRRYRG